MNARIRLAKVVRQHAVASRWRVFAIVLLTSMGLQPIQAATICVSTASAFQQALDTAAGNGQDDFIHLKSGSYNAQSLGEGFRYLTQESFDLTIRGGYGAIQGGGNCLPLGHADQTVIDGGFVRRALDLAGAAGTAGNISVSGLTVANGSASGAGAGLLIGGYPNWSGDITIDRLFVINNQSGDDGAGLVAATFGGRIQVSNSQFNDNLSGTRSAAASLYCDGLQTCAILGNTVVDNACGLSAPSCVGGITIAGTASWRVANTVFFDNEGADLFAQGSSYDIHTTNLYLLTGNPPGSGSTLSVPDPGFVDSISGDFRLRADSALRDRGINGTFVVGNRDLADQPRINGTRVDLGAFENQTALFANGFE